MSTKLYLVYPDSAESGTLETLPVTAGLELLTESDYLSSYSDLVASSKICITSEATLESILKKMEDEVTKNALLTMKDKYLFRKLLSDQFLSLAYSDINYKDIEKLKIIGKKVLKPSKGCFGTAVKIVSENSDFKQIASEIKVEISRNASVFSESVLSQSEFILEDFIEGEEYAVDMFYDSKGEPHIVNIYYHPLPKNEAYLHMIYYTNKAIFETIHNEAIQFFKSLNDKLKVKNMALHSEFKHDQELVPIEINALRFGGMGLGNMVYHSLGINPYECFIREKGPDWNAIWNANQEKNFTFFIAYNGTNVDKEKQQPDLNKLENEFSRVLNKSIFDYKKQLAFGVYTLEESQENINRLLQIDFNDYFENV